MTPVVFGEVVAKHRRDGILIDANLLLLLAVGRHDPALIASYKHTRSYSADDYSILEQFISLFRTVITTPHIMTEVSNLLGKLFGRKLSECRRMLVRDIDQYLEECQPTKTSGITRNRP